MYVMGNVTSMYLALRAMTGTTMIAMFGPGKVHASALPMWWSSLGGCAGVEVGTAPASWRQPRWRAGGDMTWC